MIRRSNWPELLAAFVDDRRDRRFEWGRHDCVTLAADWVIEATGDDLLAHFRGRWACRRTAEALLAELGGLRAAATMVLGPARPPAELMRGDIVLCTDADIGEFLGVCLGADSVHAGGPLGVLLLPTMAATCGWRI